MPDVTLSSFPQNSIEALALLWVHSQDLNGKTPEQISDMFWDAYFRIANQTRASQEAARTKHP